MLPWSNYLRQSLYNRLLVILLMTIYHDLTGETGGVQAWTYNYSVNQNLDWDSARQWCRQHYTDMVAIQNQEEIVYLNTMLPRNSQYYWIGLRKVNEMWTWMGTNKTLTKEAENWAAGEPNNVGDGQDCVEIYIKRGKDEAKWNDERCTKKKGALCYTASCSEHCCSTHAECLENIGNYTCQCDPGFKGPRCQEAVACDTVSDPDQGSVNCDHPHGLFAFNSSCQFHCARGYQLLGASQLLCQATGFWDHPAAQCQVKQCPSLDSGPHRGTMNCSNPIALHSYNSTCEFSCDLGFDLIGPDRIQCDHTGQWTGNVSTCTVVRCGPLSPPAMGNMSCVDPLGASSFTSSCGFSCEEGYLLRGDINLTCLSTGQWTNHTPACEPLQCDVLTSPPHGSMNCSDLYGQFHYGSQCLFSCEEGFLLNGLADTECTSLGTWSRRAPLCLAQQCDVLTSPSHGSMNCSDLYGQFHYGSQCLFSCEEGFLLNGLADTECTSLGTWSRRAPLCLVVRCGTLSPPAMGNMSCVDPLGASSFTSSCGFSCEEGYLLRGDINLTCLSTGQWTNHTPACEPLQCDVLTTPPHGSMNCSDLYGQFHYGSQCLFSCEEGFLLNGLADTECTSLGTWSRRAPLCLVRHCPLLVEPWRGWMNCTHPYSPFSYSSHCLLQCNEGFLLTGAPTMHCNALGVWSQDLPSCQVVQCENLLHRLPSPPPTPSSTPPPTLGPSMNCSHSLGEFSFSSLCLFTCSKGYYLNGTEELSCTSEGQWSDLVPSCQRNITSVQESSRMLVYAVVGAASAAGLLLLLGLGMLVAKKLSKKGDFNFENSLWEERENPAFEIS
ncbi:P-selectin isoform X6 [Salmo trutta]|uniref:P-selectin isoform X6 n=1 Tax=Salmo trutta TaxID=8032 RepID=UPI001130CA90|nr:P-selectin isoform X6 [Salmo trutta]